MDSIILKTLSHSAAGSFGLIILVFAVFHFLSKPRSILNHLPALGKSSDLYLHNVLIEGYQKFPDSPYTVPEDPRRSNTLILPNRYIDEVKSIPDSELSFSEGVYHNMEGKYTTIGHRGNGPSVVAKSVKAHLVSNIARTLGGLKDEADFAIPSCIGECNEWTPIQLHPKILRIIALLSGRTFVGLPLCRNEEWIDATINYTVDAVMAVAPVKDIYPLLRPFVAPRLPEVRRIQQHRINGARLLEPILVERLENLKVPGFKPPTDMIQFIIQSSGGKAGDILFQCHMQMTISMAAIHTTAMNMTQVMYNLALYPEYQEPLRKELEEVLAAYNGILTNAGMAKLKMMDSFLRESQRMYPSGAVSLARLAMTDVVLSDGFRIPKGTHTAFSSIGINFDPEIYPNPNTFDGFRFAKLREQPGNSHRYQFVTTGKDSLHFGHGIHACPGRFFASNEIKAILAGLLSRYDFKFKKGQGRPEDMRGRVHISPNTTTEILFRKRVE